MADLAITSPGKNRSDDDPSSTESPPHGAAVGRYEGYSDAIEVALAEALTGATQAQRWDIVAQLARELEARRLVQAGNVVSLDSKRGVR
ncbi:MAG: hypothetical protein FWD73_08200 [Polyangiaceae bacterium]|nr:hypothetical protein [Polyangiaceae bacterium]